MPADKPHHTLDFERPVRDLETQLDKLRTLSREQNLGLDREIAAISQKLELTKREVYSGLSAWQRVQMARHPKRPHSLDYINAIFRDFQELHGDRCFGDDHALIGGPAWFEERPVMIVAQQKGRDTRENLYRHFGMPHPEGYRKALRLMKLAERFRMSVVSFIDTKAAYAGIGSEERHVAEAIARNLEEMSVLEVPIVAIVIGEGGSGGALGIGVADRLLILEHAYYSVIPPEGCAAILWHDRTQAPQAAAALQLSAQDIHRLGVADEILPEPLGGAHCNPEAVFETVGDALRRHLGQTQRLTTDELLAQRYQKYRQMGVFTEHLSPPVG